MTNVVLAHRHRDARRHRGSRPARRRRHRRARRAGHRRRPRPRRATHAERVAALADAGLAVADLDAVVVGCGPGPFTGLRVGMATAAAYGHALGIPVYGVCSLDAIGVDTAGEVLVVTDARRREVYWARYRDGVRVDGPAVSAPPTCRPTSAAVAGSPEHAALFALPRRPRCTRRPRGWCASSTGTRRAAAARAAVSAAAGRQAAGRASAASGMTVTRTTALTPRRRRPVRRTGGPAVRRRRPVARGGLPAPNSRATHNHYVAARADDELVGYARHRAAGPKAALRVRDSHHRRRPGVPGPGHRQALLDRLLEFAAGGAGVSSRCAPTTPPRSRCTRASASSTSGCASATTASAAPTPTRCDDRHEEVLHDDHPGHRELLRRNRSRHRRAGATTAP